MQFSAALAAVVQEVLGHAVHPEQPLMEVQMTSGAKVSQHHLHHLHFDTVVHNSLQSITVCLMLQHMLQFLALTGQPCLHCMSAASG